MMEAQANPKGAIPIFQEIVKRHPNDRHYAALSQLYLGLCYKRMGASQAHDAFLEVIDNYPEQTDIVRIAELETASISNSQLPAQKAFKENFPKQVWKGKSVHGTIDISQDGQCFSYVDQQTGDLMLHDINAGITHRLTEAKMNHAFTEFAEYGVISPDAKRVVYSWQNGRGENEMRIVSVDGSENRILFHDKDIIFVRPYDWIAETDQILVCLTLSDLTSRVVLVSVPDGKVNLVKDFGRQRPDQLKASPNNRHIAYSLRQDENRAERDIYLYCIDDRKVTPLVTEPEDNLLLGWNHEGTKIYFMSNLTGSIDIWSLSIDEGNPRQTARRIKSDIGPCIPLDITPTGTFFYTPSPAEKKGQAAVGRETELWLLENLIPEKIKTLTVPDDYPTIQAAIFAARSEDIICVRNGLYQENLIIGKSLTLKGEDRKTTIIDGGGSGAVILITASNVIVSGFTVRRGEIGIEMSSTLPLHHIAIKDTKVTLNESDGIRSRNTSGHHIIEDCILSHNGSYALNAHQFTKSVIRNNEVFDNGGGLRVGWGWYIQVEGNEVHHNEAVGMYPDSCYYSTFANNLIYANAKLGVKIGYISSRNIIKENIILENKEGIYIGVEWGSYSANKISLNDIFYNQTQVIESQSGLAGFQNWDNGDKSGGNCWSDYAGQDLDKDKIGDTPHEFIPGAKDKYPLMIPYNKIQAAVVANQANLDRKNSGGNITVNLVLPARIPVEDIDLSSLSLNSAMNIDKKKLEISDNGGAGVPVLRISFHWKKLSRPLLSGGDVELLISGKLKNGLPFQASHIFKTSES